nr:hypothetical protein GCM10020063_009600 [Dactylosporangium thailandense]
MLWSDGVGLEHLLWISKASDGGLQLLLNTGDAKFGPLFPKHGRFSVRLRWHEERLIEWPSRKDEVDLRILKINALEALGFIAGREDLCRVLMQQENVLHRGKWYAELGLSSYANRLVMALIIANDLGNNQLIDELRDRIHAGPEKASDGTWVDVLAWSRAAAKEYGKILGSSIDIG